MTDLGKFHLLALSSGFNQSDESFEHLYRSGRTCCASHLDRIVCSGVTRVRFTSIVGNNFSDLVFVQ